MNFIARFLVLLGLIGSCSFCYAADIPCASRTIDRAKQLLTFHSGPDDRMTIDKTVKQLPSIRNPENPAQSFQVLEIWGYIYKGEISNAVHLLQLPSYFLPANGRGNFGVRSTLIAAGACF